VWLTGLSGAGKSTIALALQSMLQRDHIRSYILDGDQMRRGLCADLGFSAVDRTENIRRIAEVARLLTDAGVLVISACISPFRADREMARTIVGTDNFHEIFVDTPLALCEDRDPKGLYRRARAGDLPDFTGIGSPYEAPTKPALRLNTATQDVDVCARAICDLLTACSR
jgi:adenylyl-sulfate kinase